MTDMQAFVGTILVANIAFLNILSWKIASKFDQMDKELAEFRKNVGV